MIKRVLRDSFFTPFFHRKKRLITNNCRILRHAVRNLTKQSHSGHFQ
ncbi:hypothetical protein CKO_02491 [Citrobacter koseri ATCC BAA-895]|uniref:Uncharacterized protein n=1 Tax=Citrobacter koseri (strain ATCC BAA-895 / CDC 4225-83 / SGSC4696) TaxID=290338 RepID=A8AJE5_CITK8|nr:hypothetical protein CKO_02491 [Citrobacter koseri ATCC BAA-895]